MDEFELELKQDFLVESADLLEAAESAFLELEDNRDNPSLLNEIFRLAHNLKGTSKAVGFDQLAELTHVAENLILKLKEGELDISDVVVSVLLEFKDMVNTMVEGYKENVDAVFDISELQVKLDIVTNGEILSESLNQEISEQTPLVESEALQESATEEVSMQEEVSEPIPEPVFETEALEAEENPSSLPELSALEESEKLENFPSAEDFTEVIEDEHTAEPSEIIEPVVEQEKVAQENTLNEPQKTTPPAPHSSVQPAAAASPAAKKQAADSEESIRVKLSRIDKINNVIGELVILQTVISQRRYEFINDELSNKSIGMMGKLFKEVQEIAMSLRMLPLKGTFQKMNRIVRDTSKLLNKDVKLVMVGEDTEVDKTVLEKLSDPLVHIVRNAVDHGLESSDERRGQGKDPRGTVHLIAAHEGSNLVIEIKDDGKGIDPEVIRKKAIEKNVIKETANLTDDQIYQLIFHPGFSTKEQVTEVSGRGVGMDVVKTNIENLGGEVNLTSVVGKGSTFRIVLPLTLAIIEGIVIRAEEEKFVVPLTQIHEISYIHENEIEPFSGIAKLFKLRGEILPLFFINQKLGKKVSEAKKHTVVVVRGLSFAFGVAVDDILNQQQIVIKNLGDDIRGQKGIMGSAIMADGMPALILDIFDIFRSDFNESRGHQKFKQKLNKMAA